MIPTLQTLCVCEKTRLLFIVGYVASNRGREFVLAFMTNWDAFKGVPCQVAITTHCAGVVSVNITVPLLSQVNGVVDSLCDRCGGEGVARKNNHPRRKRSNFVHSVKIPQIFHCRIFDEVSILPWCSSISVNNIKIIDRTEGCNSLVLQI